MKSMSATLGLQHSTIIIRALHNCASVIISKMQQRLIVSLLLLSLLVRPRSTSTKRVFDTCATVRGHLRCGRTYTPRNMLHGNNEENILVLVVGDNDEVIVCLFAM